MSAESIFENLLTSHSVGPELPPLWQVIYQEGIRGNHLLFRKHDLAAFDAAIRPPAIINATELAEEIESLVFDISQSHDLSAATDMIDAQSKEVRHCLFVIYKHFLNAWAAHLKSSLN